MAQYAPEWWPTIRQNAGPVWSRIVSIRGLLLAQRVSDVFPGISFLIPHYQNIKHIIENWLINRLSAKRKEFPGIV
jgi:hypothetical protein